MICRGEDAVSKAASLGGLAVGAVVGPGSEPSLLHFVPGPILHTMTSSRSTRASNGKSPDPATTPSAGAAPAPSTIAAAPPIACPSSVMERVRWFDEHIDTYISGDYSEAQLRIDFINPLLEALGWDVNNKQGHAEAYREVVYEDALKIRGGSKAPDYGFYIGGRAAGGGRKFFLEAKRPAVAIRVDPKPAFQLRRYAYSAQLPLSILTNFRELVVYDTRYKPTRADGASAAAVLTIKYTEYPQRWHEIASIFSRDAILRGAFDKFAQGKRKKGIEPLGEAFLKDIEAWRAVLARDVAINNPVIGVDDLNFAVQRTIDRILFLRICEDRGIEAPSSLLAVTNGPQIYPRLGKLFRDADDRYNSGIFHFPAAGKKPDPDRAEPPDDLTLDLTIGDDTIRKIVRDLYDSPTLYTSYAFAVIPPEILGQVYERFLGKVIRLTPSHNVRIEQKPEVRKAGGVYYTPAYIVDYIVKHTVGKLLEGRSPKEAARLTIVDPASGSGSFLIGAYQYLLDWHLRWYLDNDPEAHCKGKNPALMRTYAPSFGEEPGATPKRRASRDYRLTIARRKEILLNSIYGVDIDPQAVEVTKLSLLLKVLEDESKESIAAQLRFLHQRALPDLGRNIKCGNSLIGDDFDDSDLSGDARKKVNAFNWQSEFPSVFKSGGFDAVIGNPPYVLLQDEFRDDHQLAYFRDSYAGASYKLDTYHLFMEKGIRLLRQGGLASMITPANFLANNHLAQLRRLLLTESHLDHILIVDGGVFDGISVDNAIYVLAKHKSGTKAFQVIRAIAEARALSIQSKRTVERSDIEVSEHLLFTMTSASDGGAIWERAQAVSTSLGALAHVNFGKQLRNRAHYAKDVITVDSLKGVNARYRPCYTGGDVKRYSLDWNGLACLDDARAQCGGCWDSEKQNSRNKLITRQIGRHPIFALDAKGYQCLNTVFMVNLRVPAYDHRYVLGVLNSRLIAALWLLRYYDQRRTFPKIKGTYLKELPIRTVDFSNKAEKATHDRMVKLVDRMLDLHKRLATAKSPLDKERLPREIESTDRQIDQLVYELYGLTGEEIALVERATSKTSEASRVAAGAAQAHAEGLPRDEFRDWRGF